MWRSGKAVAMSEWAICIVCKASSIRNISMDIEEAVIPAEAMDNIILQQDNDPKPT